MKPALDIAHNIYFRNQNRDLVFCLVFCSCCFDGKFQAKQSEDNTTNFSEFAEGSRGIAVSEN